MIRLRCPVKSEQVQLGGDGVVAIPAAYREAMGLKAGEMLNLRLDEEGLHIQSQRQAIA
jgi:AbrB family looped-hinge helix DNA binding protein